MPSAFSHPLARHAKVWSTTGIKGKGSQVLVVVTTLELDEQKKGFKAGKVKRLSDEAAKWVTENSSEATEFMLVSRPKDWDEQTTFIAPIRKDGKHYPSAKS